jgi:hypothetical protein
MEHNTNNTKAALETFHFAKAINVVEMKFHVNIDPWMSSG